MSQFLPESYSGSQTRTATQTPQVQSQSSDALLNSLLGDDKRVDAMITALFGDPNRLFRIAPEFFSYMQSWIEQSGLQIPISQVPGATQFHPKVADTVVTNETTVSLTYTDLATTGPTLSGIGDGSYMILHAFTGSNDTAGCVALMSFSIDGAAASDNNLAQAAQTGSTAMTASFVTLTGGGNHTIQAKYRGNVGGTASFARRSLAALKYANQ